MLSAGGQAVLDVFGALAHASRALVAIKIIANLKNLACMKGVNNRVGVVRAVGQKRRCLKPNAVNHGRAMLAESAGAGDCCG